MPKIEERIADVGQAKSYIDISTLPPFIGTPDSLYGLTNRNLVPIRSLLPNDYMSHFETYVANPQTPYFVRNPLNSITFVRNTALQALSNTTKVN